MMSDLLKSSKSNLRKKAPSAIEIQLLKELTSDEKNQIKKNTTDLTITSEVHSSALDSAKANILSNLDITKKKIELVKYFQN